MLRKGLCRQEIGHDTALFAMVRQLGRLHATDCQSAFSSDPRSRVGSFGRIVSVGRFDRFEGLFLLEKVGAQVAEGGV